jgi:hypothetical protein
MSDYHKTIGEWSWNTDILWSKIVKTEDDSCWAWIGSVGPQTNLFGARRLGKPRMTQARRILYRDVYDEDCEDKQIKMRCKNAYCMNWHHFETRPNQRRYYDDGIEIGQRQVIDKTAGLQRAKLKKVKAEWQQGE